MRAIKWRRKLMGTIDLITELRKTNLIVPTELPPDYDVMMSDMTRTYPETDWYNDHLKEIRMVLVCYATTNPSIGYAQGMCFIVFALYRVYYEDNPKHAVIDTFYSLHTIMRYTHPLYPRDDRDTDVLRFIEAASGLIRLNIITKHNRLALKMRGNEFIKLLLIKTGPALFANWFSYDDILIVWDYIFQDIFKNLLNFVTAMIVSHENIYLHMNYEKTLHIISEKSFYRAASLVSSARTFGH